METNKVSVEKKSSILNSLAIAGFIAIVALLAWLSIQLVQMFPNAFSSLASLAEGINQASETMLTEEQDPILITTDSSLIKTGEQLMIEWESSKEQGSYAFSYECVDGVAINQIDGTNVRELNCGTNYNVGNISALNISIESEKERYADITYSIGFLATDDAAPVAFGTDIITIINEGVDAFTNNSLEEPQTTQDNEEILIDESTIETTPTTPQSPVFEQEFVYEIPTSDPNGVTDLAATFLAMGEVNGGRFVPGAVAADNNGAIQFSVKNYGTKTSKHWTFAMSLPNGGTYNSPEQEPLKPNEVAVLTIGFPAAEDDTTHTFEFKLDESTDRNSRNDSFEHTVTFTN